MDMQGLGINASGKVVDVVLGSPEDGILLEVKKRVECHGPDIH
jgi:hypothetical protein